jgi:dienelactone hydrolase
MVLDGSLFAPEQARGIVLFAHGSGSSRMSPRNRAVAQVLTAAGFAALLFDLLSEAEEVAERHTGVLRFDIALLAERLIAATDWVQQNPVTAGLPVGYFGASTGAAAALVAAAALPEVVRAVVSRGGRPDLAGDALPSVGAATLLIVGGNDAPVIDMNKAALALLGGKKRLEIVPGATHLFEEPGTLEQVARLAGDWFEQHLAAEPKKMVFHHANAPSGRL